MQNELKPVRSSIEDVPICCNMASSAVCKTGLNQLNIPFDISGGGLKFNVGSCSSAP